MEGIDRLPAALSILTAMLAPAFLISACGTMILSTSNRLGRVVDRVRALADRFESLAQSKEPIELFEEKRLTIFDQLDKLTSRARLLQRAMVVFYVALGMFVATSVALGVLAIFGVRYYWVPVVLGFGGASLLLYGSMLLIFEARLALLTIHMEMDFIWQLGKHYAPAELVERYRIRWPLFRRRR